MSHVTPGSMLWQPLSNLSSGHVGKIMHDMHRLPTWHMTSWPRDTPMVVRSSSQEAACAAKGPRSGLARTVLSCGLQVSCSVLHGGGGRGKAGRGWWTAAGIPAPDAAVKQRLCLQLGQVVHGGVLPLVLDDQGHVVPLSTHAGQCCLHGRLPGCQLADRHHLQEHPRTLAVCYACSHSTRGGPIAMQTVVQGCLGACCRGPVCCQVMLHPLNRT